jgi:hypothetical protein
VNSLDTNLLVHALDQSSQLHAMGVKTFYTRNLKDFRSFGLFDVIDPTMEN